jgi:hypothetical protein
VRTVTSDPKAFKAASSEELENEKNKTKQLQVAFAKSLKEIGIPIDKIQKKNRSANR